MCNDTLHGTVRFELIPGVKTRECCEIMILLVDSTEKSIILQNLLLEEFLTPQHF